MSEPSRYTQWLEWAVRSIFIVFLGIALNLTHSYIKELRKVSSELSKSNAINSEKFDNINSILDKQGVAIDDNSKSIREQDKRLTVLEVRNNFIKTPQSITNLNK